MGESSSVCCLARVAPHHPAHLPKTAHSPVRFCQFSSQPASGWFGCTFPQHLAAPTFPVLMPSHKLLFCCSRIPVFFSLFRYNVLANRRRSSRPAIQQPKRRGGGETAQQMRHLCWQGLCSKQDIVVLNVLLTALARRCRRKANGPQHTTRGGSIASMSGNRRLPTAPGLPSRGHDALYSSAGASRRTLSRLRQNTPLLWLFRLCWSLAWSDVSGRRVSLAGACCAWGQGLTHPKSPPPDDEPWLGCKRHPYEERSHGRLRWIVLPMPTPHQRGWCVRLPKRGIASDGLDYHE